MANPVDPNDVLMTGENSFVRLSHDGGKTLASRFSHWRVLWCAAGAGHALFVQSELTDNKVRIYSDNAAVARWLQKSIESLLFPAPLDERRRDPIPGPEHLGAEPGEPTSGRRPPEALHEEVSEGSIRATRHDHVVAGERIGRLEVEPQERDRETFHLVVATLDAVPRLPALGRGSAARRQEFLANRRGRRAPRKFGEPTRRFRERRGNGKHEEQQHENRWRHGRSSLAC